MPQRLHPFWHAVGQLHVVAQGMVSSSPITRYSGHSCATQCRVVPVLGPANAAWCHVFSGAFIVRFAAFSASTQNSGAGSARSMGPGPELLQFSDRFAPVFAGEIRRRRVDRRNWSNWRWHLDEVFVRINGEMHYLWRAVDHEGEVLEVFATKRRDRRAALRFLKRAMKCYGRPEVIVTDRLRSYGAAMKDMGVEDLQLCGQWPPIEPKTHTNRSADEKERWPGSGRP